jgi:hypothetical protein
MTVITRTLQYWNIIRAQHLNLLPCAHNTDIAAHLDIQTQMFLSVYYLDTSMSLKMLCESVFDIKK